MSKMTYLWKPGVFFQAIYTQELVFSRGFTPDPAGGGWGLRRSPRPSSRLGRGTPPPHILPPRRLRQRRRGGKNMGTECPSSPRRSASRSRLLRRLGCQAPQHKFLATPMAYPIFFCPTAGLPSQKIKPDAAPDDGGGVTGIT